MILLIAILVCFINYGLCGITYKHTPVQYPAVTDCLLKILNRDSIEKSIVFIEEELQEEINIGNIIKLEWDRIIVSSSNVSSVSGLFVFLPGGNKTVSYEKIMKYKRSDYNSIFILCTDNMRNIMHLFDVAWENEIIDVIALFQSTKSDRISVFTYYPYGPFGCSTTDPVRINIYEPNLQNFLVNETFFSKTNKLHNFYKCPVRVTLSDKPSGGIMEDNIYLFKGVSVTLLEFLKLKLNFTVKMVSIGHEANTYAAAYYNFTSAVVLSILNGESDLGVGRFSQLIDNHRDIETPTQTNMDCFTWAVPMKAGMKPSVWITSVYEFDYITWIFIIFSLILAIYVVRFFNELPFLMDSVDGIIIFATFLNISINMNMKSPSLKVFVSCWLLYCFVITSAYSASLGSLVTVPPDSSDIVNSEQLLEKDFILTGEPKMYHILSASSETSPLIKNILDKFTIMRPGEFKKIIYKIYTTRNIAVFYTKNTLIQEEIQVISELGGGNMVHIIPQCLITSHTSPLIMRKGSVLLEPVKDIVVRLLESGIIYHWENSNKDDSVIKETKEAFNKFTISQLRGALIVAVIGHFISSVVFSYELISTHFYRRTSKSLDQQIFLRMQLKNPFIP